MNTQIVEKRNARPRQYQVFREALARMVAVSSERLTNILPRSNTTLHVVTTCKVVNILQEEVLKETFAFWYLLSASTLHMPQL